MARRLAARKIDSRRKGGDPAAWAMAAERLALSGLSPEDGLALGMYGLSAAEAGAMGFEPLPALAIPYLGPDGRPMEDWPGGGAFVRVRYLAQPQGLAGQALAKPLRYAQPPGTSACAYLPASWGRWEETMADPAQALVLTEGELKAASGVVVAGVPTVGLGGVYNWRALGKGVEFLPSLEAFEWRRRNVYLCFDSDYTENPMVCAALRDLAEALVARGAFPHVASLPAVPGLQKTGLDDLLVAKGRDELLKVLALADPLGLAQPLFGLNDRYCYVRDPGLVVDRGTRATVSPEAFKGHLEAARSYHEGRLMPDGGVARKAVSAAAAWLSWPLREQAPRLTYAPGRPERVEGGALNVWPGWGCEPRKGDHRPFLRLVDHLFQGAEPEARDWFLRWLAWPLRHPGAKLYTCAVLHGRLTGTGKSLVGYTMGRIYGKNFTEIGQAELEAGFNEWADRKQLIMGDDVTGTNKRAAADAFKKMVTQRELRVNVKYVPSFTVPDCVNFLLNSNHADPLFLEDDDRRAFVHEVEVGPLPRAFYAMYAGERGEPGWLDKGGAEAVFWYLTRELDMGDFDPAARAFRTAARERMVADAQSDLGGWVRALLADPEAALSGPGTAGAPWRDLWTSAELLAVYDPMGRTGTTANGLGRELKRAGVPQAARGVPLRGPDGRQARYYALRDGARWRAAAPAEAARALAAPEGKAPARGGKF